MNETFDFLTLALLPGVRARCVRALAARAPLRDVLAVPAGHADLIPPRALSRLASGEARREAEAEARRAAELRVSLVGLDDESYPPLLRQTYDPPPVLYVRGSLDVGREAICVAIVGSRAASLQGTTLARAMARDLVRAGVVIVSGLARGIDTAAHRGALDGAGRTIAVLGSGLDRLYPRENARLAAAIERQGAVVSEFRLGTAPYPGHFPRRNRVIAGWGRAVVVAEAAGRSGALGTAREALDAGREVMAVPGHPAHLGAAGVNQLIRDGAALVRGAADVAGELKLELAERREEAVGDKLLELLRRDAPQSIEEIQQRSGWPVPELLTRLGELEVGARVRRLPGSLYVRA